MPGTWQIGNELYVGMQFDSKEAVQFALKNYSLKIHQSYRVTILTPAIYAVKCSNACYPFRMRTIISKKSNKLGVTKWGGQHTCIALPHVSLATKSSTSRDL